MEKPVKILENVSAVSLTTRYTMAIQKDGTLMAWGSGNYGQLGTGSTKTQWTPVKVMDQVTAVSLGFYITLALQSDGTIWGFGWDAEDVFFKDFVDEEFPPFQIVI